MSTAHRTSSRSEARLRRPSTPRAIWSIAIRELTDHIMSARFLVIALLVVGLTPLAIYVGASDYRARLQTYSQLEAERQEIAAGPAGQRVTGRDGEVLRAVRPPEVMSMLVQGLDAALPTYWEFSATGIVDGPPATLPQRLADVFGQLDFEFLSRVVLGLLAILLAFDAVAGEKEQGTLRAVLSQPVSRPSFIAGKLLGGTITLLAPLTLVLLITLVTSQLFGVNLLAEGAAGKVALLGFAAALYLVCLYSLGLLVSTLMTSQKTSLVILLVVWVVAVLAVPPISTLVAQAVAPVPPSYVIERQKRALDEEIRTDAEIRMGAVYREMTGHPEGQVGGRAYSDNRDAIAHAAGPILVDYLNERRRLVGEIEQEMERRAEWQGWVARTIMAVSPAAAFASAATNAGGTGDADRLAWLAAVRQHQTRLNEALFEDPPYFTYRNGPARMDGQLRDPLPSIHELPAFAPPRRDATAALSRALPGLGLLIFFTSFFIAASFIAFARYDVR